MKLGNVMLAPLWQTFQGLTVKIDRMLDVHGMRLIFRHKRVGRHFAQVKIPYLLKGFGENTVSGDHGDQSSTKALVFLPPIGFAFFGGKWGFFLKVIRRENSDATLCVFHRLHHQSRDIVTYSDVPRCESHGVSRVFKGCCDGFGHRHIRTIVGNKEICHVTTLFIEGSEAHKPGGVKRRGDLAAELFHHLVRDLKVGRHTLDVVVVFQRIDQFEQLLRTDQVQFCHGAGFPDQFGVFAFAQIGL